MSRCLTRFPWASFGRTKAEVKLPTLLDHGGYLLVVVAITPAREQGVKKARTLNLPRGSVVVENLGSTAYAWHVQLNLQKIFFVIRQKSKARYRVLLRRPINVALGLVSDESIQITDAQARACPQLLRRIVYQHPDGGWRYVFPNQSPQARDSL